MNKNKITFEVYLTNKRTTEISRLMQAFEMWSNPDKSLVIKKTISWITKEAVNQEYIDKIISKLKHSKNEDFNVIKAKCVGYDRIT